jgi:hypothetical protein
MDKCLLATILASTLAVGACFNSTSASETPITAKGSESGCTLTQGYWKNHPDAWPVSSLELGSVSYTKDQALAILGQSVSGNGLVALAHQLIAAKLNVASGATNAVATTISAADALIGSLVAPPIGNGSLPTAQTSALTDALDSYNSGMTDPGHCDGGPGSGGDTGSGSDAGSGGSSSGSDSGSSSGSSCGCGSDGSNGNGSGSGVIL